jgi:uncharacterized phage protein gp47/JayE
MPWQTPTLAEVRSLNRDYIAGALPGADATIPNSVLRVMADANGGLAHLNLLYLDWLALQLLPDTAEAEWLDRHGEIWLGGRKAATFSTGACTFTGVNGTVVPLGTRLTAGNGAEYETTEEITLSTLPTEADIRAIDPGVAGNQLAGAILRLPTAISGVDASAVVVTLAGGVDIENDDSLRERVLFRIRKPPMGGDADDYVAWARSFAGVTRAWSFPLEMGMGTVTVRIMMDELRASSNPLTDGFPTADDLVAARAYLDTLRPVAVKDFFVQAPIPQAITLTISGLQNDSASVRAAIEARLKAMLRVRAKPGQTIFRSWVSEAISQATGEDHHDLTFANTPMAGPGYMAVLGNIIYDP